MSIKVRPVFLVFVLIAVAPLGIYAIKIPGGIGFTPINFLAFISFPGVLLYALYKNRVPSISVVGGLHLLYILTCLAGGINADNKLGVVNGVGGYFIDYFLCFFYVVFFVRTKEDIKIAVKIFIVVGLLNACMGYIELIAYYVGGKIVYPPFAGYFKTLGLKSYGFEKEGYLSIPGLMKMYGFDSEGSNAFGAYMLIPFGLSFYYWKYKRLVFKLITFFLATAVFFSFSRHAYVGAFVIVVLLYIFYLPKSGKYHFSIIKRSFILISVMGILLSSLYAVRDSSFFDNAEVKVTANVSYRTPVHLLMRLNPFIERSISGSIHYFSEHAQLAYEYGISNYGLGRGLQNFDDYVYDRHPVKYGSHSNFIIFLGDAGLIGFLIQIMIVMFTVYYGANTFFKQSAGNKDNLPLILTSIFLGLFMTGVVRTFYLMPITFVVAGLIVKLYMIEKNNHHHEVNVA